MQVMNAKIDPRLVKSGIRLISFIVGLALLRFFIELMPVFHELKLPGGIVSLFQITGGIFSYLGLVLVILFAYELEETVPHCFDQFPESGILAKEMIFILCTIYGYSAFRSLFSPFLASFTWVYQVTFLLLFLAQIFLLGKSLYRHNEKLGGLLAALLGLGISFLKTASTGAARLCAQCQHHNDLTARFCSACGAPLKQQEEGGSRG